MSRTSTKFCKVNIISDKSVHIYKFVSTIFFQSATFFKDFLQLFFYSSILIDLIVQKILSFII